jgi:hypothetical protein
MSQEERNYEIRLEIHHADGFYEHHASDGLCCELPLAWRPLLCPDCRAHEARPTISRTATNEGGQTIGRTPGPP